MSTKRLELNIDAAVLRDAQHLAASRAQSLEALVNDALVAHLKNATNSCSQSRSPQCAKARFQRCTIARGNASTSLGSEAASIAIRARAFNLTAGSALLM